MLKIELILLHVHGTILGLAQKGPSPVLCYFVCLLYSWFILLPLLYPTMCLSCAPGHLCIFGKIDGGFGICMLWQRLASCSSHPFSSSWEISRTLSRLPLFLSGAMWLNLANWMVVELRCATSVTWVLKFSYAQSPMLFPLWPLSIWPWKLHIEDDGAKRWKELEHHLEESHPPIRNICFRFHMSEK